MKRYVSPSQFYQLDIPIEWSYSEEDNLVSFYNDEDGVGTLQISSYLIDNNYEVDISLELAEFVAESQNIDKKKVLSSIKKRDNLVFYININNGAYWEYNMLLENGKLLFITYNCQEKNQFIEKNVRQRIVESIMIN